jgi:hypothetical protein
MTNPNPLNLPATIQCLGVECVPEGEFPPSPLHMAYSADYRDITKQIHIHFDVATAWRALVILKRLNGRPMFSKHYETFGEAVDDSERQVSEFYVEEDRLLQWSKAYRSFNNLP